MTAEQQELIDYMAARRCRHESSDNELSRLIKPVCVFALMIAGGLAFNCLGNGPERPVDPSAMAATMAQGFVYDHLHCPATSSFSLAPAVVRDGDAWRVTSYVDAQNKFGAKVREHWTATVKQQGSTWQLLNLEWINQ